MPLPGGIHVAMSVCVLAGSFEDMKQRDSSSMTRREVRALHISHGLLFALQLLLSLQILVNVDIVLTR